MELRQLEYLVAVAEEAGFTRAAARVHVAQPGVSAQIRRLEDELGERLLDRSGGTVTPTAAGEAVLPLARAALASVGAIRQALEELGGLVRGRVAVGMVIACPVHLLPGTVADFHREHPGVEVSLVEDGSDRLLEALAAGRLDLALVGLAGDAPPAIATRTVVDEPFVAAIADGHPLAGRSSLPLRALAAHPLICLPRGTGGRSSLEAGCAAVGVSPRIAVEASDPRVLAELARRGLGVAILPRSSVAATPGLHGVRIGRPGVRGRLALAWREGGPASPAARALIDFACASTQRVL